MSELYTYWLLPEVQTEDILRQKVSELAEQYDGPIFEPHMTLLGSFAADLKTVKQKAAQIAEQLKNVEVSFGKVEYSTTYFQDVFVRINAQPKLMEAYVVARDLFGIAKQTVFMPHISLLYGYHTMTERHTIAATVELPESHFRLQRLVVTPAVDDPSQWEHLLEIEL